MAQVDMFAGNTANPTTPAQITGASLNWAPVAQVPNILYKPYFTDSNNVNVYIKNLKFSFIHGANNIAGMGQGDSFLALIGMSNNNHFKITGTNGLQMGDGTGKITINLDDMIFPRSFTLDLSQVKGVAFKGNLEIQTGGTDANLANFSATFGGNVIGDITTNTAETGWNQGKAKMNFVFSKGANLTGNIIIGAGSNTFTFADGATIDGEVKITRADSQSVMPSLTIDGTNLTITKGISRFQCHQIVKLGDLTLNLSGTNNRIGRNADGNSIYMTNGGDVNDGGVKIKMSGASNLTLEGNITYGNFRDALVEILGNDSTVTVQGGVSTWQGTTLKDRLVVNVKDFTIQKGISIATGDFSIKAPTFDIQKGITVGGLDSVTSILTFEGNGIIGAKENGNSIENTQHSNIKSTINLIGTSSLTLRGAISARQGQLKYDEEIIKIQGKQATLRGTSIENQTNGKVTIDVGTLILTGGISTSTSNHPYTTNNITLNGGNSSIGGDITIKYGQNDFTLNKSNTNTPTTLTLKGVNNSISSLTLNGIERNNDIDAPPPTDTSKFIFNGSGNLGIETLTTSKSVALEFKSGTSIVKNKIGIQGDGENVFRISQGATLTLEGGFEAKAGGRNRFFVDGTLSLGLADKTLTTSGADTLNHFDIRANGDIADFYNQFEATKGGKNLIVSDKALNLVGLSADGQDSINEVYEHTSTSGKPQTSGNFKLTLTGDVTATNQGFNEISANSIAINDITAKTGGKNTIQSTNKLTFNNISNNEGNIYLTANSIEGKQVSVQTSNASDPKLNRLEASTSIALESVSTTNKGINFIDSENGAVTINGYVRASDGENHINAKTLTLIGTLSANTGKNIISLGTGDSSVSGNIIETDNGQNLFTLDSTSGATSLTLNGASNAINTFKVLGGDNKLTITNTNAGTNTITALNLGDTNNGTTTGFLTIDNSSSKVLTITNFASHNANNVLTISRGAVEITNALTGNNNNFALNNATLTLKGANNTIGIFTATGNNNALTITNGATNNTISTLTLGTTTGVSTNGTLNLSTAGALTIGDLNIAHQSGTLNIDSNSQGKVAIGTATLDRKALTINNQNTTAFNITTLNAIDTNQLTIQGNGSNNSISTLTLGTTTGTSTDGTLNLNTAGALSINDLNIAHQSGTLNIDSNSAEKITIGTASLNGGKTLKLNDDRNSATLAINTFNTQGADNQIYFHKDLKINALLESARATKDDTSLTFVNEIIKDATGYKAALLTINGSTNNTPLNGTYKMAIRGDETINPEEIAYDKASKTGIKVAIIKKHDGAGTGSTEQADLRSQGVIDLGEETDMSLQKLELKSFTYRVVETKADGTIDTAAANNNTHITYFIDGQGETRLDIKQSILSNIALSSTELYLANFNSLNRRMGELRDNAHSQGAWGRIFNGMHSNDVNLKSSTSYTTIQAGYDYGFGLGEGVTNYLGFALSYGHSESEFKDKVTINVNSFFGSASVDTLKSNLVEVALYNSYVEDSGWYNDTVAKFSYLFNQVGISEQDSLGSASYKGDINTYALTLSNEFGYRIKLGASDEWYIDPQAELGFGYFNGKEFNFSEVKLGTMDSLFILRSRLGVSVGYDFKNLTKRDLKAKLYLGLFSEIDHFSGGDVKFGSESAQWGINTDARAVLNIGTNLEVKDNTRIYMDLESSFGGKITTDYKINAGVRYSFGEKMDFGDLGHIKPMQTKSAPMKLKEEASTQPAQTESQEQVSEVTSNQQTDEAK